MKSITSTRDLQQFINTPLKIQDKTIPKRLVLAPLAGLGHIAFRELVDEFGGFGLLFTGMCSAKALPHENPKISTVFNWRPQELSHTVCQIFGPEPDIMALAAQRVEKEGFFGVDLNFGCSVAAICKKGSGAALLKTPDKAVKIVEAVRQAVDCPVFVKFRTGWTNDASVPVDLARRFEDAGANALTFHPRVAPDRRSRPPKWEVIGQVAQAVDIPVFGNGNLFLEQDAIKMLSQTGCEGLSLGRIAVAQPWIFSQWSSGFVPDSEIYLTCALKMARLLRQYNTDHFAVKLFKKFAPYFCANFKFSHSIRKQMVMAETMDELEDNILRLLSQPQETLTIPNINLFV